MSPAHFQQLLDKFSQGACSPEEEQLVIDWYNNISSQEPSAPPEAEMMGVEDKIWTAIKPRKSTKRRWLPLLMRAAIVTIPLLAGAAFYLSRQSISYLIAPLHQETVISKAANVFKNAGANPQEISLADGSLVILQPASEIRVNKNFGGKTREVHLKGEAFFDVKRDVGKPFLVYSREVVTKVLGTSFNIRAYDNDGEITVAVKTGKVSVYTNKDDRSGEIHQSREVILSPNQQMVYHRVKEKVSKELVALPEIILPNSDLFRMQFKNVEVSKILQVLEENYGITIRYDKDLLDKCKLTTSMSDEGLYERIEVICKAIGASYSIDDDATITIRSSGC